MSPGWFMKSRPAIWSLYVASQPQLAKVPDLGNVQDQSFSIEKTLAVKPDLVILAKWQYEALAADLPRLEQAGIPVVVIDYNAQTLTQHMASTLLLGKLTGQEARARKMADEYKAKIDTITSRIAAAKRTPPRVYIELGDKGPAEYSYTYGRTCGAPWPCWPVATTWPPLRRSLGPHPPGTTAGEQARGDPDGGLREREQCRRHAGGPGCVGRDRAPASARLCCPSGLERAACGEGGSPLRGLSRRHPQHHGCRPHRVHG